MYRAALALGTANQLTNILRDVGEDASQRNRIYVPLDELAAFKIREEEVRQYTSPRTWLRKPCAARMPSHELRCLSLWLSSPLTAGAERHVVCCKHGPHRRPLARIHAVPDSSGAAGEGCGGAFPSGAHATCIN